MSEAEREGAPDKYKEGEKYTNWHLTEGDGGFSVGTTEDEVGFYPEDDDLNRARSWVAPGREVDAYLKENKLEQSDVNIKRAIEDWVSRREANDNKLSTGDDLTRNRNEAPLLGE